MYEIAQSNASGHYFKQHPLFNLQARKVVVSLQRKVSLALGNLNCQRHNNFSRRRKCWFVVLQVIPLGQPRGHQVCFHDNIIQIETLTQLNFTWKFVQWTEKWLHWYALHNTMLWQIVHLHWKCNTFNVLTCVLKIIVSQASSRTRQIPLYTVWFF